MKHYLLILITWALPFLGSAQQWVVDLSDHEDSSYILDGVSSADGDVMAVGYFKNTDNTYYPLFIKIHNDGSYEEPSYDNLPDIALYAVTKLNNGNYLSSGISSDQLKLGVVVFNEDLDIISTKIYDADTIVTGSEDGLLRKEAHVLLDDDGTVVMCGAYQYRIDTYTVPFRPFFYRFDEMGNILDYRYAYPQQNEQEYKLKMFSCLQIKKSPISEGYLLICYGRNGSCSAFAYYDKGFNYVSDCTLMNPNISYWAMFDNCNSDYMLSDDRMLVYGYNAYDNLKTNEYDLLLADVSVDGTVNSFIDIYHTADTSNNVGGQHCMAVVNDTTIYGSFYSYLSWKNPEVWPGVCLFNKNMELLGLISLPLEQYYWWGISAILPIEDGGCMMIGGNYPSFGGNRSFGVMFKLLREDFNPIPCSVNEIPEEQLKATAFPNPTRGELNIDISDLPQNTENRVSITDMQGITRMSRIIQGSGNLLTIDASALEVGVYFYSVYNREKEIIKEKFIKN
jgi:hypothetical protein